MKWVVSIPCWGDHHRKVFLERMLPNLKRAAFSTPLDIKLLIHGEDLGLPLEINNMGLVYAPTPEQGLPGSAEHANIRMLWTAHHEAFTKYSQPGDFVMPLNADMLLSEDVFAKCEWAFDEKAIVLTAGPRVAITSTDENSTDGPSLYRWAWANRHWLTQAMVWPDGGAWNISRIYFDDGVNVVSRQAMPTPVAVKMDGRPLWYAPTVDVDLVANFKPEEIHLVTDKSIALCELCPMDKQETTDSPPIRERIARTGMNMPLAGNRSWLLDQRMVIVGDNVDCGDSEAVATIQRVGPH